MKAGMNGEKSGRAPGKVWLVGAGPGDPGLITVKGLRLLERADVVLYDALSHPALLDHCPQAELRDVGKRGGHFSPSQDWITSQLIALAREGKRVVRLKGGDSFLFARGAEEAEELAQANVEYEVVPGLSSPVGTSAYAGIPLTHRDLSSSVTFITGSDKVGQQWSDEAWKRLATATDTICILMGMQRLDAITQALIAGGRSGETPAAVVQWGARPAQRVVVATLSTLAERVLKERLSNPAVIIVGEVVALRESINWYESKPLFGRRILVPRPAHQAKKTAEEVRERGAEPVVFPVIEIASPPDLAPIESALRELQSYDWVLFTSANGVDHFFAQLSLAKLDARALGRCLVGVIGPRTGAALRKYGVHADLVAEEFIGEGLASAVLTASQKLQRPAQRVLIPRALVARDELPTALRAAGMEVNVVPVYQTRPIGPARAEQLAELLVSGGVDAVMFTSSSTVTSTVAALTSANIPLSALSGVKIASIGPVTTETALQLGVRVDVTASEYTVEGLLDALEAAGNWGPP
ncbi:MAG: hypothetical protein RJA70_4346 [Pseudomonadota bacterium]|jgi:uroporphyrinogen III methyltransferase/synthase